MHHQLNNIEEVPKALVGGVGEEEGGEDGHGEKEQGQEIYRPDYGLNEAIVIQATNNGWQLLSNNILGFLHHQCISMQLLH